MLIKLPIAKSQEMIAIAAAQEGMDTGRTGIAALLLWRGEILILKCDHCIKGNFIYSMRSNTLKSDDQQGNRG